MSQSATLARPAAEVLSEALNSTHAVGRNHRCPCGSGRKFKVCCHPLAFEAECRRLDAAITARMPDRLPSWNFVAEIATESRELKINFYRRDGKIQVPAVIGFPPGKPRDYSGAADQLVEQLREAYGPKPEQLLVVTDEADGIPPEILAELDRLKAAGQISQTATVRAVTAPHTLDSPSSPAEEPNDADQ